MALIGKLVDDGTDVVTLDDQGTWSACEPDYEPTAKFLDATEHPTLNAQGGDHHLPRGVMSLNRAAQRLGLNAVLDKTIEPLPPGAVS